MKFIVFFCLFYSIGLSAQIGFQSSLSLDPGEPNSGCILASYNDGYIISGQYFDLDIGRWEASFAYFDSEGNFQWQKNLTADSTGTSRQPRAFLIDSTGFAYQRDFGDNNRVIRYDTSTDSIHISTNFKYDDYNFITWGARNKPMNDTIYFSGQNYDELIPDLKIDVMMLRVTPLDTIVTRTENLSDNSHYTVEMTFPDSKNILLACYETKNADVGLEFASYINKYLSLIHI